MMKHRARTWCAAIVLALTAAVGTGAVTASAANAWAWSGSVTLQGTSLCGASRTTWVWVSASNGEAGWATNGSGNYKFNFTRVPSSGMSVTVYYGNSTFSCHDTFGVQRPAFGTTATRNVYKLFPNG
jgi:hypothetical protein